MTVKQMDMIREFRRAERAASMLGLVIQVGLDYFSLVGSDDSGYVQHGTYTTLKSLNKYLNKK